MADCRIEQDVADVLRNGTASGNVFFLPPDQLDRKLYERVNKALANAGGKWKRGTGHVFPVDAAPKIAAMLGTGVSVDEKKRDQSFFTPPELAARVVNLADVCGYAVLEPSAGSGNLADACIKAGAQRVECFEINSDYCEQLEAKGYKVDSADFLDCFPLSPQDRFWRIVMNPPFTKNQDIKHIQHALDNWLAPDGVLVSLMMPTTTRKAFQDLVRDLDCQVSEVSRGTFEESGTEIATAILKVRN